ncbi:MAG: hypothetical protein CMM61_09645 [Rhodospirillaceae bacterium]|nr:hypothetical protein [Rhodospirillaceae bacterium]
MLLCLVIPTNAFAAEKTDFLNWDYVVGFWTANHDLAAAKAEQARVVPAWKAWSAKHGTRLYPELVEKLNDEPNADLIKKGHDFTLMVNVWRRIYTSFMTSIYTVHGARPWNANVGFECENIQALNIFTRQCNDVPDWRKPETRRRDEAEFQKNPAKRFQ